MNKLAVSSKRNSKSLKKLLKKTASLRSLYLSKLGKRFGYDEVETDLITLTWEAVVRFDEDRGNFKHYLTRLFHHYLSKKVYESKKREDREKSNVEKQRFYTTHSSISVKDFDDIISNFPRVEKIVYDRTIIGGERACRLPKSISVRKLIQAKTNIRRCALILLNDLTEREELVIRLFIVSMQLLGDVEKLKGSER